MPKRKNFSSIRPHTKRRKTARTSYPRYKAKRTGTRIYASLGLPEKSYFRHKYVEFVTYTSQPGVPWQYKMSTNSMFDPNPALGGHQPYYFDEMAALYNHYRVISSKCKVTFSKLNAPTDVPSAVSLWIEDDLSGPLSLQTSMELGRKTSVMGADDKNVVLRKAWAARKAFPSSKDLSALSTSNPAEQQFFWMTAQPIDGQSTALYYIMIELEYFTQWFERKTVSGS